MSLAKSKYLGRGMFLLYLDQCAISRFLDDEKNEEWSEIRSLILRGNESRRLLCPASLEHMYETASLDDDRAIALDRLLRSLSFGWSLMPEPRLIARQVNSRLRQLTVTRNQFLQRKLWQHLDNPGTLQALRHAKTGLDKHNAWLMQGLNEFNEMLRKTRRHAPSNMQKLVRHRRSNLYVRAFIKEIDAVIGAGAIIVKASEHHPQVADMPSLVVYALMHEHRIGPDDLLQFRELLRTEGLECIPLLHIKAELEAAQMLRGTEIKASDQYDDTRIASALPYADILITDGVKASAVRELKLDQKYNTMVLSVKRYDRQRLIAVLTEIVNR
jgi:hypothetical protein